jgi:glutamyl-tRNA synthetase
LAAGPQGLTLAECGGDFALRRSDGVFAYQLAVVVDDLDQGVTSVVRGRDLLVSVPRQLYLLELLGGRAPAYAHVPLILDHRGERLAKRHAGLSLSALREAGVRPESIFGFLARLAGLSDRPGPLAAGELTPGFAWDRLRPEDLRLPESLADRPVDF